MVDLGPAGVGGLQQEEHDRQQQGGRDQGAADDQHRQAVAGEREAPG